MGNLKITSEMNSQPFNRGIDQMETRTKKFGRAMSGIGAKIAGAFTVTAIVGMTREAARLGSEISDLAKQSGLTNEQFQALEIATIKAGVSSDKIRTSMAKLNVVMGQAKRGQKLYIDLFKQVGISMDQLQRLNPAQVLEEIAHTATTAAKGSSEFGAVLELLGTRSAAQLTEVLEELSKKGLQGLIDQSKKAGEIIDEDLIKKLDEVEDKLQLMQRRVTLGIGGRAASALSGFEKLTKQMAEGTAAAGGGVGGFFRFAAARHAHLMGRESKLFDEYQAKVQQFRDMEQSNDEIREHQLDKEELAQERLLALEKGRAVIAEGEKKIREGILDQEKALVAARAKLNKAADHLSVRESPANRLAKIGGFLGGTANPRQSLMDLQSRRDQKLTAVLDTLPDDIAAALRKELGLQ